MKSIEVLKEQNLICWSVLLAGLQRGWVEKSDIANYAIDILSAGLDNGDENIAVLAGADSISDTEIKNLLLQVGGKIVSPESIEKWRLAKLTALEESALSEEEKLGGLQDVYAEFDYPEDMASCSIYAQGSVDPLVAMTEVISALKEKVAGFEPGACK